MTCIPRGYAGGNTQHDGHMTRGAGARGVRWVALLMVLAWLVVGGIGGPLVGRLSEVQTNDNGNFLPESAESTAVNQFVLKATDTQSLPYLLVAEKTSGLTDADRQAVQAYVASIPGLAFAEDPSRTVGEFLLAPPQAVVPSQDNQAVLIPVAFIADKAEDTIAGSSALYAVAEALRTAGAAQLAPAGMALHVTGPGGFFADFITAFGGIDGILLFVALGVVFVILLIVYRSPILPIAVLVTALFGLSAAALVIYPLAKNGSISLSGQSQGILSILVVGASTDYALLLVARYKEELHQNESTWAAMKTAWRAAVEPIAASAATVILGLLCLQLSELGNTRGLGPVGAFGIAGAFIASLTFLPAVLLLIGRRIFWPGIPKVYHTHAEDSVGRRGIWGRVAGMIGAHARRTWIVTFVLLAACAAFVPTFEAKGVQVVQVLGTIDGVQSPQIGLVPGQPPKVVDGQVLVQATLVAPADSVEAESTVETIRTRLDAVSTEVLVGGSTAVNLDVRQASERDLKVIIPAILGVIFVVLLLLLRSITAPLVLVAANLLSFAATIGVSAVVFNHVFHFPGSDPSTPLYGFVFLVALGIDYSIFLMTRVREESRIRGTRPGIAVGLAVTGGVITSAGIVLASTFSALAVVPI